MIYIKITFIDLYIYKYLEPSTFGPKMRAKDTQHLAETLQHLKLILADRCGKFGDFFNS